MRGTTPVKIDQLKVGDYTIDLKLKDHLHESRQVKISRNATDTINVNLTSFTSIEQEIAELNKQKQYYFIGSAGALASALLLYSLANYNYGEYKTARSDATKLHQTVDQQFLYSKLFFGVGMGSAIMAIMYHVEQSPLSDHLERSK